MKGDKIRGFDDYYQQYRQQDAPEGGTDGAGEDGKKVTGDDEKSPAEEEKKPVTGTDEKKTKGIGDAYKESSRNYGGFWGECCGEGCCECCGEVGCEAICDNCDGCDGCSDGCCDGCDCDCS